MAEFCTKCSLEILNTENPDINLKEQFERVKEGCYISVLCEGCAMDAIARINNECVVHYGECSPVKERVGRWFKYDLEKNEVLNEINID